MGFLAFALLVPELSQAGGSSQLQRLGLLMSSEVKGVLETALRLSLMVRRLLQQECPLSRYSSGSYQRSPVLSTSVSASVSTAGLPLVGQAYPVFRRGAPENTVGVSLRLWHDRTSSPGGSARSLPASGPAVPVPSRQDSTARHPERKSLFHGEAHGGFCVLLDCTAPPGGTDGRWQNRSRQNPG